MTDHRSTPGHPGSGPQGPYGRDAWAQRSGDAGGHPAGGRQGWFPPFPPQAGPGTPEYEPGRQTYPIPPGYGPPPDGVPPVGAGVLGKRRNPFAAWLGLPIITLGVYFFVWVYKTNKELAEYDRRIKVDPTLSALAFLVGWLLVVPPFIAAWRLGVRTRAAQRAAGIPETSPAIAFLIWLIGGGPLFLQFEINHIWDRYPGAVEGQQVPLSS